MTEHLPDPLHLTRCDPDLNMARFYLIALEPTLFGEVSLVRSWGRIGSRGQVMMKTFAEVRDADAAADRLRRIKRRRGYRDSMTTDPSHGTDRVQNVPDQPPHRLR